MPIDISSTPSNHRLQQLHVSSWRRAAESLFGGIVLTRHLPATAGGAPVAISGKVGGLKYVFKRASKWDPPLLDIAARLVQDGSVVWDIGANVGLFASAAAFHAGANGKVLAIEADNDAVALLNRTCLMRPNGHAPITVLPVAVAADCGFVRFDIAARARASNALAGFGNTQMGGVKESRTLPCVTLDELLRRFSAPDVLKIDVEGAETEIMRGANDVLDKARPVIYCEVQDGTMPVIAEMLALRNYHLWDGDKFDGTSNQPLSSDTCNLLAIPQEKSEHCANRTR